MDDAKIASARSVIVNADDFGLTAGVNRGIGEAHENGILTSASLMVRYPAAVDAAAYARSTPRLSVGLHFDAGEWAYRDGDWELLYRVVDSDDADAVRAELEKQLDEFEQLLQRKPTHIDSHQHIHLGEAARAVFVETAARLRVPLRSCTREIAYNGGFYGQSNDGSPYPEGVSAVNLIRIIESLPPGWTELGTHPGYADDLDSVYAAEREQELRVLCDPQVRAAIERSGVRLCSFADLQL